MFVKNHKSYFDVSKYLDRISKTQAILCKVSFSARQVFPKSRETAVRFILLFIYQEV